MARKKMEPYGLCVHNTWVFFKTKAEAIGYCIEAIGGTDGSEQMRYARALGYLCDGWTHINTDYACC